MLFVVFVVSVAVFVGFAAFSLRALLGGRKARRFDVPAQPIAARRIARGSTPPPIDHTPIDVSPFGQLHDNSSSRLPGVISNREDATEPDVAADARFSVRRSRPRLN